MQQSVPIKVVERLELGRCGDQLRTANRNQIGSEQHPHDGVRGILLSEFDRCIDLISLEINWSQVHCQLQIAVRVLRVKGHHTRHQPPHRECGGSGYSQWGIIRQSDDPCGCHPDPPKSLRKLNEVLRAELCQTYLSPGSNEQLETEKILKHFNLTAHCTRRNSKFLRSRSKTQQAARRLESLERSERRCPR
jgi:hypothetical protein